MSYVKAIAIFCSFLFLSGCQKSENAEQQEPEAYASSVLVQSPSLMESPQSLDNRQTEQLIAVPDPTGLAIKKPKSAVDISPTLVGTSVWYQPPPAAWNLAGKAKFQIYRIGGIEYDYVMPSKEKLRDWVRQIRALGGEPMIQISRLLSPEEAAAYVRYFNQEINEKVIYWNVGNEPWIELKIDQEKESIKIPESELKMVATKKAADYIKRLAPAMKQADPSIKIFAPGECYYMEEMYNALLGGEQDIAGKDPNGNYYIDGISWHQYVGHINKHLRYTEPDKFQAVTGEYLLGEGGRDKFLSSMIRSKARLDFANKLHQRTGSDSLLWGIGEFNANYGDLVNSFENGQMFAMVYGDAMRYGASFAISWSMYERNGDQSEYDTSLFDGPTFKPRSSYQHSRLVAEHFSGWSIEAKSNDPKLVVYAAMDPKKDRISVMLINTQQKSYEACTLVLSAERQSSKASGCQITVDAGLNLTHTLSLPAQGTRVQVFQLDGKSQQTVIYQKDSLTESGAEKLSY